MQPRINDRTALVVIDVQQGFEDSDWWGPRDNARCEENIERLLQEWRNSDRPIVLVQHSSTNPKSPLHPSNPGHALQSFVPGKADLLVDKSVNSSFHGTPDLHDWLQANNIRSIVICGITTNHCCETTARVGGNLGYEVFFALDATHTFDRNDLDGGTVKAAELSRITGANLHKEFATVLKTQDLLNAGTNTMPTHGRD